MSTKQGFKAEDLQIDSRPHAIYPHLVHVDITYLPTGDHAFAIKRYPLEAKAEALENLYAVVRKEAVRSAEITTPRDALLNAMSWSNANLKWSDDYRMDDSDDQEIADDILKGLMHVGWKLVKSDDR